MREQFGMDSTGAAAQQGLNGRADRCPSVRPAALRLNPRGSGAQWVGTPAAAQVEAGGLGSPRGEHLSPREEETLPHLLRANSGPALSRRLVQIRSCPWLGSGTSVRVVVPSASRLRSSKASNLLNCLICSGVKALAKTYSSSRASLENSP